jgi:hypothetical protein
MSRYATTAYHANRTKRTRGRHMSALGHSRPGPAGRRSSDFRYAPKATFGHQNAIGRDGPKADITLKLRSLCYCPEIDAWIPTKQANGREEEQET